MSNKNSLVGANAPDWDEIDPDGSSSRLSQTNRPRSAKGLVNPEIELEPNELPHDIRLDRLSVEPGRKLRDECVHEIQNETQSRPLVDCVNEFRDWYDGYESSHMRFEKDGETVRAPLENSYQPDYGKKYYAKLNDLQRAAERHKDGVTTAMLTFTASHVNAHGKPRRIADHMRDVQDGYNAARKRVADVLSGYDWEYARVWEPHKDGYGHLHMAIFIFDSDPEITESDFEPVMRSHVRNCKPAGYDPAHKPENDAVNINNEIDTLGTYISKYIGIFGESPLDRSIEEQIFYTTTWATGTQKVTFSNGAHELMKIEQFRRETGLKPEDRGSAEDESEYEEIDESTGWEAKAICTVNNRTPHYNDPTSGGIDMTAIDGSDTLDPPPERE